MTHTTMDLEKVINQFDKKGMTILDLGCGDGYISKFVKYAKYVGVDYATNKFIKKDLSGKLNYKADLILILGLFEDEPNPLERINNLKYKKLIFTLHNADSWKFKIVRFIKTHILRTDFPYTSFTKDFLKKMIPKAKITADRSTIYVEI